MARHSFDDLIAFLVVARERSFTRAAARLGVSQPALSHTVRSLEERLGLRLLTRTTRNVAPTEAGERLLRTVGPHFDGIEAGLEALSELRDKAAGNIRITVDGYAVGAVLWPALAPFLLAHPDIKVEVVVDDVLTDIVEGRFDAGVRLGEVVAKDMIAVPISPELRMAAVASPSYFANRPRPRTPQDLTAHICINRRMATQGGVPAWVFEKNGRELRVRVEGQVVFNDGNMPLLAALDGLGIAFILEQHARPYIAEKRLVRVLADWCEPFAGYHLYYPSRRQATPAFALLVEALRFKPRS
jgi:DNA-binding transcriptional LysR family regulator